MERRCSVYENTMLLAEPLHQTYTCLYSFEHSFHSVAKYDHGILQFHKFCNNFMKTIGTTVNIRTKYYNGEDVRMSIPFQLSEPLYHTCSCLLSFARVLFLLQNMTMKFFNFTIFTVILWKNWNCSHRNL